MPAYLTSPFRTETVSILLLFLPLPQRHTSSRSSEDAISSHCEILLTIMIWKGREVQPKCQLLQRLSQWRQYQWVLTRKAGARAGRHQSADWGRIFISTGSLHPSTCTVKFEKQCLKASLAAHENLQGNVNNKNVLLSPLSAAGMEPKNLCFYSLKWFSGRVKLTNQML